MKITNKQYALGLYEAIHRKGDKEAEKELMNFVHILAGNGDISRADAIIAEFEKVWQAEKEIVEAQVVSADKLEAGTLELLKKYVASETGMSEVELKSEVDKNLLSGFILRFNDQILDGTAKNMISNFKKELIK